MNLLISFGHLLVTLSLVGREAIYITGFLILIRQWKKATPRYYTDLPFMFALMMVIMGTYTPIELIFVAFYPTLGVESLIGQISYLIVYNLVTLVSGMMLVILLVIWFPKNKKRISGVLIGWIIMTEIAIHTERVDDIPLLFGFLQQMGIQETLDKFVESHGNRQGLSVGWLITAWLSYIVSESDHRMIHVESWAAEHMETLSALIPQAVDVKDFTDDRLADVLQWLSRDNTWAEVENHLSQHLVQVYQLHQEPIRLDSTTASVYHDTEGNTLHRRQHLVSTRTQQRS